MKGQLQAILEVVFVAAPATATSQEGRENKKLGWKHHPKKPRGVGKLHSVAACLSLAMFLFRQKQGCFSFANNSSVGQRGK